MKQTCLALTNICSKSNDLSEPFKLEVTHRLFENLSEIITKNFTNLETNDWIPMSECALTCVYKLADNPVVISETLILRLIEFIGPIGKFLANEQMNTSGGLDDGEILAQSDDFNSNPILFTRFMSFVGFVSIKFLIFLNTSIVCELKRRKTIKENKENKNTQKNAANKKRRSKARKSIARRSTTAGEIDLEEEMGLQGAEAEDAEQVLVDHILDSKVAISSLFTKLSQFAISILKEPAKFSNEKLQLASAMALLRIMCLSRRICIANLQLIFTIVGRHASELVRSELILGIGDLIYRFPNELDPWTSHLYSPLRDASKLVKMNTIRLLSHLILKEQIKTHGQLFEIAICTIDEDSKIVTLSKLFFQEFSKLNNGNAIYNNLPDIISHLTKCTDKDRLLVTTAVLQSQQNVQNNVNEHDISEESFRQIVSYLFSFIKKDKQCKTLIEKLSGNFKHANTERKSRDLRSCLTKININDSGVKKLFEMYKHYENKFCIESVCELFRRIIKNAKKILTLKVETKKLIEDYDTILRLKIRLACSLWYGKFIHVARKIKRFEKYFK